MNHNLRSSVVVIVLEGWVSREAVTKLDRDRIGRNTISVSQKIVVPLARVETLYSRLYGLLSRSRLCSTLVMCWEGERVTVSCDCGEVGEFPMETGGRGKGGRREEQAGSLLSSPKAKVWRAQQKESIHKDGDREMDTFKGKVDEWREILEYLYKICSCIPCRI